MTMKLDRFGSANEEAISILENKYKVVLQKIIKDFYYKKWW